MARGGAPSGRSACSTTRGRDVPTKNRSIVPDTAGATKKDILELTRAHDVRFLRLQFTDILGVNKNVEVPASQFDKALDGEHHVRRFIDRGVRAHRGVGHAARPGSEHVPRVPLGRRTQSCGASHLRHHAAERRRRSRAIRARVLKKQIERARDDGLHDERRHGSRVLHVQAAGPSAVRPRRRTMSAATSISPPWTSAKMRGA